MLLNIANKILLHTLAANDNRKKVKSGYLWHDDLPAYELKYI